jgi:NifU-like protein
MEGFKDLSIIQKHTEIERVLDESIRPMLNADGGDLEVMQVESVNGNTEVKVRYSGACHGCEHAQIGTLNFVEETLQKLLDPAIYVFANAT